MSLTKPASVFWSTSIPSAPANDPGVAHVDREIADRKSFGISSEALSVSVAWTEPAVAASEAKAAEDRAPRSDTLAAFLIESLALGVAGLYAMPFDAVHFSGRGMHPFEERPHVAPPKGPRRRSWIAVAWSWFVACRDYLRRQREIARSQAILSQLDDRALRDIGIDRGQIPHAVRYGRDLHLGL
ncbi:MAG TPA: DUF1127 domain-containing protein [Candidatus Binatia bacterium]|nr:DUF1127 domain-containing protein [Candidatus Binatia bacterium]